MGPSNPSCGAYPASVSKPGETVGQRRRLRMTEGHLPLRKRDPVTVWREEQWDGQRWVLVAQAESEQGLDELLEEI